MTTVLPPYHSDIPLQRRHENLRRPWNNIRDWHNTLLRLASLEELMVKTLISISSSNRTEQSVVTAWASGAGRRAIAHPTLVHIALIQKDTAAGATQQRLEHWFKRDTGVWALQATSDIGPTESFSM